jgi:RimJ/RimL family protein N-acetyltransferase
MFEGKLVSLRALEKEDLSILKEWRNTLHVRKSTREYKLLNMINQKNWFESIHQSNPPKEIMFGILDKKKKLIGVTGLTYIDWKNRNSEISIYFSTKNWQTKPNAKEVINLIMEYGFEELNLHRLYVEIFSLMKENTKLFSQMKFIKEGELREKVWRQNKWWNTIIFSKLATEYQK